MNKKLLLLGAVFVIIVVVAIALFRSGGNTAPGPSPSPTLAPPAPTGVFVQPQNVTFSFASPTTIPTTLPIYSFQSPSLSSMEQVAAKAAPALGLNATPSAITRGNSYTKMWTRPNEASLKVSQTDQKISITFEQSRSDRAPGTLTPDVAVQQFLLTLVSPATNLSVRANGTTTGPFDGLLVLDTPAPTSYMNHFYSYVVAGSYPVLSTDLDISPASVIVDGGGIIRSATISPPPASIQASGQVILLNQNQILASLSAGRGTLLYTHNSGSPDQGAVPNFLKFVIKDAKIVYAPQGNLLLPALYMTGTGTAASGATQETTIFLWMSPENSIVQP